MDYISRDALLERVSEVKDKLELDLNKPFDDGVRIGFENVEIEIENFPAADVREVKWISIKERLPVGGDKSGAICENMRWRNGLRGVCAQMAETGGDR